MSEFAQFISYGGSPKRREQQLRRKKKRYHEDDEHREKKKAASRARYTPVAKRVKRRRGRNKPRPWTLPDGRIILLIGLGQAADALSVSKQTLRGYEDREVIPVNRLVDSRGRRWYSQEFIEFLAPLLKDQSKLREPLWCLRSRVEQAWTKALEAGGIPLLQESQESDG
jgi:hypothetical protein